MASFSFGAGNAAKLLRIPVYLAGRVLTWVIPRGERWVFGSGAGIGDGALELWHQASGEVDAVWLVDSDRDAADARARGIPTIRKSSWRGFWATARAGVLVVTHGLGDVNRYATPGAFLAQLWHGIPLKRIGLDSVATTRLPFVKNSRVATALMARLYRGSTAQIDVIPAASQLVRGRLESAFGLPDARVIVTGEPRVDPLSTETPEARKETARKLLQVAVGDLPERVVVYAPTWRDGAEDPAVPSVTQWLGIVELMAAHDAVLLIRSHPLGAGAYDLPEPSDRVRMIGSDVVRDVTPVMPAMDVLITDYSSMLFDAGLIPAGVVYLAPDVTEYAATRGFYGSYEDVAGEDYATTWDDAIEQLQRYFSDDAYAAERRARSAALSERVHDFRDGKNAERVYREIHRRRSVTRGKGTT